jgi:hypothetical protein
MQVTQELITPKKAQELLKLNKRNRTLRPRYVMQLARAIQQGEWQADNPQPIIVNGKQLITGQHRLSAVVETGIAVKMWVARGAPTKVAETIDTGVAINLTDKLKMDGESYAPVLAGVLRQLFQYEREGILGGKLSGRITPSHNELLKVLERWPDARDATHNMARRMTHKDLRNTGSPSLLATAYCVLTRIDAEDAEEFFESLLTGAELGIGNPILALRRMMVESRRKPQPRVLGACLVKAWNGWRAGDTIYLLAWKANQEPFPEIHGGSVICH